NPFTASATADTLPGAITPHNTNATVNSADTTNTGGFVCSRRYCRTDEPAEDSTAGSSEPAESRCSCPLMPNMVPHLPPPQASRGSLRRPNRNTAAQCYAPNKTRNPCL